MKNGRKPSYNERKDLEAAGLDPREWLITKVFPDRYEIQNRETKEVREVRK